MSPALEMSFHADVAPASSVVSLPLHRRRPDIPNLARAQAAARAFRIVLDHEARMIRDWSPWWVQPDEVLDDRDVREGRARDARGALEDAARDAVEAFFTDWSAPAGGMPNSGSGLRLSDRPSWRFHSQGRRSAKRIDLPLTPTAIRFYYWREFSHGPGRLASALVLHPWDEEVRFAVTFGF